MPYLNGHYTGYIVNGIPQGEATYFYKGNFY